MKRDVSWLFEKPIAHRGAAMGKIPENSLVSFEEAIKRGMPIELDVHITKDNQIVVFHDFDTSRMTGKKFKIEQSTVEELKKLTLIGDGEQKIPTLKEVLDLVDGQVGILIELKVGLKYKKLCRKVLEVVKDYKGKIAFQGFSQRAMAYIAKLSNYSRGLVAMDYVKYGFKGIFGHTLNSVPYFKKIDPDFLNFNFKHYPSKITKKFVKAGLPMTCWTIKTDEEFETARKFADNIVCNARFLTDELTTTKYEK